MGDRMKETIIKTVKATTDYDGEVLCTGCDFLGDCCMTISISKMLKLPNCVTDNVIYKIKEK